MSVDPIMNMGLLELFNEMNRLKNENGRLQEELGKQAVRMDQLIERANLTRDGSDAITLGLRLQHVGVTVPMRQPWDDDSDGWWRRAREELVSALPWTIVKTAPVGGPVETRIHYGLYVLSFRGPK